MERPPPPGHRASPALSKVPGQRSWTWLPGDQGPFFLKDFICLFLEKGKEGKRHSLVACCTLRSRGLNHGPHQGPGTSEHSSRARAAGPLGRRAFKGPPCQAHQPLSGSPALNRALPLSRSPGLRTQERLPPETRPPPSVGTFAPQEGKT